VAKNDDDRDRGLQGRSQDQREQLDRSLDDPSHRGSEADAEEVDANPPHTTTGKITAPKFGSAGSGGAELEPGPPRP